MTERRNAVELLTRYPVRTRFDPRENRLTAAVVAALDQSHELRAALIQQLWDASDCATGNGRPNTAESSVVAQRPVVYGDKAWFVDTELCAAGGATRVWIEAKVASPLSGKDQLTKYVSALRAQPPSGHKLLALLAPAARRNELERHLRHVSSDGEVAMAFASWEQVHRLLGSPRVPRGGRWFVNEVRNYMEDQGYGSVTRLTAEDAKALVRHERAVAAVQHLFDETDRRVAVERRRPRSWTPWRSEDYLEGSYPPGAGDRARRTSYRRFAFTYETSPMPTFGAGAYVNPRLSRGRKVAIEAYVREDEGERWRCELEADEPYLWRDLPLGEIVALKDVEAQVDRLKVFVDDTFDLLDEWMERLPEIR